MNDHEDSREAFEVRHTETIERDSEGLYLNWDTFFQWEEWKAALDWRNEQVCEWLESSEEWDTRCEASYSREWPASPYCPNCGRRVKIQEQQTNDTNEQ